MFYRIFCIISHHITRFTFCFTAFSVSYLTTLPGLLFVLPHFLYHISPHYQVYFLFYRIFCIISHHITRFAFSFTTFCIISHHITRFTFSFTMFCIISHHITRFTFCFTAFSVSYLTTLPGLLFVLPHFLYHISPHYQVYFLFYRIFCIISHHITRFAFSFTTFCIISHHITRFTFSFTMFCIISHHITRFNKSINVIVNIFIFVIYFDRFRLSRVLFKKFLKLPGLLLTLPHSVSYLTSLLDYCYTTIPNWNCIKVPRWIEEFHYLLCFHPTV